MNSYLKNIFVTAIIVISPIKGAHISFTTATSPPPPPSSASSTFVSNPAKKLVGHISNNRIYRAYKWFTKTSIPIIGIKLSTVTTYTAVAVGAALGTYHTINAIRHPTRTIKSLISSAPKAAISSALFGGLSYLCITHDGTKTRKLIHTCFKDLWGKLTNFRDTITTHTTVTMQASESRIKNEIVTNKEQLEKLLKAMQAEGLATNQVLTIKLASALEQLEKLEHNMQQNQLTTHTTIDETHKKIIAVMTETRTALEAQINTLLREITEHKKLFAEQQKRITQSLEEQNKILERFECELKTTQEAAQRAEHEAISTREATEAVGKTIRSEAQATRELIRVEHEQTRAAQAEQAERLYRVAIDEGATTRAAVLAETIKTQGMQRLLTYIHFMQKRETLKALGRAVRVAAGPAALTLAAGAALTTRKQSFVPKLLMHAV